MKHIVAALVWLAAIVATASAAPSGGSISGGSWSGAGGGATGIGGGRASIGGIGGIGAGGGGVVDPSSARGLSGASGPDSWPGLLLLGGAGLVAAAVLVFPSSRPRGLMARPRDPLHVGRLRVAFAPSARSTLVAALRSLGTTADASHAMGRAALLADVALLLRRNAVAAAYAAADTEHFENRSAARAALSRRAHDARALFVDEQIRNDNGVLAPRAPAARGTADAVHLHERGSGFTVVTLLVATRHQVFAPVVDRPSLDAAIAALTAEPLTDLRAIEVVWMPADTAEPLTSIAVEARMPDLHWLEGAVAGSLTCDYCSARYPAEDLSCPRCGASASASTGRPPGPAGQLDA